MTSVVSRLARTLASPVVRPLIGLFDRPLITAVALLLAAAPVAAQSASPPLWRDQSAAELHRLVAGLTITPRVLVLGMHPDDEHSELIAWLSRGRHIETAYLSVTRGEAGTNFGGIESGTSLGAIRTQEVLAARRLDGAQQFFTRAYDFGYARTADEVFMRWERDSVLGDLVAVIRAFRPHVIVAMTSGSVHDGDGQHEALDALARDAFAASADLRSFPPPLFGMGWPVPTLYRYGEELRIETAEYDRQLGKTYAALALEARAQHRSQGLSDVTTPRPTVVQLGRVASRAPQSTRPERSLFDGIDTSFARLARDAPPEIGAAVARIALYADSARRTLDAGHPAGAVPYLAEVARLATSARAAAPWCWHPSANAAPPAAAPPRCHPAQLDLDASIDLVRERSVAALLIAAGISFEATADRELVATHDTATVTVTLTNRGTAPVSLTELAVWGSPDSAVAPIIVPPDSAATLVRRVTGLSDPRPWWIGNRVADRFVGVMSSIDGLARGEIIAAPFRAIDVAVPENIRRTSDVTVALTIAGAAVMTSLGPVIYPHADAQVGLQYRPLAGVPDVTLRLERGLEWLPRQKPITRTLRAVVASHSDRRQQLELRTILPPGLRVDSLPRQLTLEPRQERELLVQLRGTLQITERQAFGLIGGPLAGTSSQQPYYTGFRTVQRDHLPPIRLFRNSGLWIQPIDIEVPRELSVLYVPGVSDDIASALKQVGVAATAVSAEHLLSVDLASVTTIALGPRALQMRPELLAQAGRLLTFVRGGGTLVVLRGDSSTISSPLLPYPIALARPLPERVAQADAPVTVLHPAARLLTWPNRITAQDWSGWAGARAQQMPSIADPRYATLIEVHDAGQPENRNAILVARVGKGTIIYSALTLDEQIAGGVPGALRLLVNLLSAGLAPAR
jgi:LmbE family N-acetylglucosaminyl deacetylase